MKLRKNVFKIAFVTGLPLLASTAMASNFKGVEISAGVGTGWVKTADTTLVITPYETDSALVRHVSSGPVWKLGVGYHFFQDSLAQRPFFNDLLLELNFYHSTENIGGDVWQYQTPVLNNYSFNAPITTNRLMLDVKPSLFTWHGVSLYPILGAGEAWNKTQFSESVTGDGVEPNSNIIVGGRTTGQFAYDLGVGMHANIDKNFGVALEYLYTNFGHATPDGTPSNPVPLMAPPRFRLSEQALMLNLTWTI